ncbi:putative bifunctional diguanylate cyclase/phosphodiesterase [Aquabacterium humicola]|uniref:putative bifunctional diguanylate cyclase/phosphodiesterase n=1 Tax=Aquabacterium humicola TaxID=3237377 RepID=UPI0025429579|nr:bifunctional diguanylate cyclase/phosphodiesterase [Rubrivivax pictus]
MLKIPSPSRRVWPRFIMLVAAVAAAVVLLMLLLRQASTQLLQRDAEHVALAWAELASASIEDLEGIFRGEPPTPAAHRDLLRHRKVQEVFRFKLFDRDGRVVLVSDDLDRPAPVVKDNTIGHGNAKVRDLVLNGKHVIELKQGQDASRPALYSEAYVPVMRGGRVIGVVEVYVDQAERAQRIQAAFGLVAAGVFALLGALTTVFCGWWYRRLKAERAAEERARYLSRHDVLSGLLNRSSFNEALDEAAWRHAGGGPGFSVLCVDLDHFKEVNDTQGHAAGDDMLRQVGDRLRALVRQGDRVARLASDEFALLLSGATAPESVTMLAERVIAALAEPFQIDRHSVSSGCSIGAAVFGVDASTPDEVLHKADLALQRAKQAGRGAFHFYDATLDRRLDDRRQLVRDLREAIGSPQMALHYQALYAADGRTVTGYEALLRWRHPVRGPIAPVDFIPLAEDSGLIAPLGRWVLETACAAAAGWPAPLTVAVNLSAAQFSQGDLVDVVRAALEASGLEAARLEVEITESLLLGHTEEVTGTLRALDALGVKIAMDDFGTGYSSLSYLWRFPFHKVKIDRSFTLHLADDPKVRLIVRSIVSLARSLGLRVNAEGVENEAQLKLLQEQGCDELQGFLLARPLPLEALTHPETADVERG